MIFSWIFTLKYLLNLQLAYFFFYCPYASLINSNFFFTNFVYLLNGQSHPSFSVQIRIIWACFWLRVSVREATRFITNTPTIWLNIKVDPFHTFERISKWASAYFLQDGLDNIKVIAIIDVFIWAWILHW